MFDGNIIGEKHEENVHHRKKLFEHEICELEKELRERVRIILYVTLVLHDVS